MRVGSARALRGGRLLLGVSMLAAATSALAQEASGVPAQTQTQSPSEVAGGSAPALPEDDSNPGEIVVTALKRATSIQQTPLAISAVTAESLVAQGITDSQQLTRTTPNLIINESANGGSRVIYMHELPPRFSRTPNSDCLFSADNGIDKLLYQCPDYMRTF